MKCPHCSIHFHEHWDQGNFECAGNCVWFQDGSKKYFWMYQTGRCPACDEWIIQIGTRSEHRHIPSDWRQVYPVGANRGPVSSDVPSEIAHDYIEACNVLPISPKASAALSRRCLQNVLRAHGYKAGDLAKEIDLLLNETDPKKALPHKLRMTVDGIRNFGNFSAHPINDKTTLQVIDVESHEAEWCLEIIEEMFDHFYVAPAAAKAKKAALDAKLVAAGKPPSK